MKDRNNQTAYKIIVVGSSGVGKSAIVDRLVFNKFKDENASTVGVEVQSHMFEVDGQPVKLQIWDTAGQERFRSVSRAYFRNAIGAILVFDITSRESFEEAEVWLNDIHSLAHQNAVILCAGNKNDMNATRKVSCGEINEFVEKNGLDYFETSALAGTNVTEVFMRLAYEINARVKSGDLPFLTATPHTAPVVQEEVKEESMCC